MDVAKSRWLKLLAIPLAFYSLVIIYQSNASSSAVWKIFQTTTTEQLPMSTTICLGNENNSKSVTADSSPLLCIFTTFRPLAYKEKLYLNTLYNWINLDSQSLIKPILYLTNDTERSGTLATLACHLGWTVLMSPKTSSVGVPYFKAMYADVAARFPSCDFYGFSNGDLLYTRGLIDTLVAVKKVLPNLGNQALVIGRRTNFRCCDKMSLLYTSDAVGRAANLTRVWWRTDAIDFFFIARNAFPWNKLNDTVIGRPGYDNYVVSKAVMNAVPVIDATQTLPAVHQTDRDGIGAGARSKGRDFNFPIIGPVSVVLRYGQTHVAQFYTRRIGSAENVQIVVTRRKKNKPVELVKKKNRKTIQ